MADVPKRRIGKKSYLFSMKNIIIEIITGLAFRPDQAIYGGRAAIACK